MAFLIAMILWSNQLALCIADATVPLAAFDHTVQMVCGPVRASYDVPIDPTIPPSF